MRRKWGGAVRTIRILILNEGPNELGDWSKQDVIIFIKLLYHLENFNGSYTYSLFLGGGGISSLLGVEHTLLWHIL